MDEIIRVANLTDTIRIVDMGRKFLMAGPYKELLKDNPEYFVRFTMGLLLNPNAKILVATTKDNYPIGVLAFIVNSHYLSGELTASELIWYVEPNYRGQVPLELFWAAQKAAKEMGAIVMQFTAPTESVGAIYKRSGYQQIEVGYQKRLD